MPLIEERFEGRYMLTFIFALHMHDIFLEFNIYLDIHPKIYPNIYPLQPKL